MNQAIWRGVPGIQGISELGFLKETCMHVLSLCNKAFIREGVCVHGAVVKLGMHDHLYLNNNLLSLYAKCFALKMARQLFDEMPERDVVSWSGIMSAYVKHGRHTETLRLFKLMLSSGVEPNEYALSSALQSCCALQGFELGTEIQAYILRHGLDDSNPILGSSFVNLYSQYNLPEKAYTLFTSMNNQDTVLWTAMISSFVSSSCWKRALQLYLSMVKAGVSPNEFTFVKVLAASTSLGLEYGKLVHAHAIILGIGFNLIVKTAAVDMYLKCRRVNEAIKVSKETPACDVFLWTAMISGLTLNSSFDEAISIFLEMMMVSGARPNTYVLSAVLSACSSTLSLELGQQLHAQAIISGCESDSSVSNALIDLYSKCSGTLEDPLRVFRRMEFPNVISWTSLISCLVHHGSFERAFEAFLEMRYLGMQPNPFTISVILSACGAVKIPFLSMKFHGHAIKINADHGVSVQNGLVDVYAGLGNVEDAWRLIRVMTHRDATAYTSLATRLNELNCHELALRAFTRMLEDGVRADDYSMSSFLSASSSSTMTATGRQLHGFSMKSGLCSGGSVSVLNSLIGFYGNCGCLSDARRAFEEMPHPDVVSWNGLIRALASNGRVADSLSAFENMRLSGSEPDSITFLSVLFSCSHGRLPDLGLVYFEMMKEHGVEPQRNHYACLVDILGRSRRMEEAMGVIRAMPFPPHSSIYKALLSACTLHGNVLLGEDMARKALELDSSDPELYTLIAGIYEDACRPDLAGQVRRLMRNRGVRKNPRQSWIEERGMIHVFESNDETHPEIPSIREVIASVAREMKNRRLPFHEELMLHSEKLAVAFGLLRVPAPSPVRVFKNYRICVDCHGFMLVVSQLYEREIVVRDRNCFHSIHRGACSCNGYW